MADSGTYADDCMVNRVTVHKCYIVATVGTPTYPLRLTDGSAIEIFDGEYGKSRVCR